MWTASALSAFFVARIIPVGRRSRWIAELGVAIAAAWICGVAATALDFGGWREPDWRAALFALFGGLTALALLRAARLSLLSLRR